MKKFRFDPIKNKQKELQGSQTLGSAKAASAAQNTSKQQLQKQGKKSKLQRQIEMLNEKIAATTGNIKQTEKLLDIDLFLKKQKEKRLEYAKKLNEEYEHDKKQREKKLYKVNRAEQGQKLTTGTIKSEVPLNVFGALQQIHMGDNPVRKWILEEHYHKIDEMLLDKNKSDLFGQELTSNEEQFLKEKTNNSWKRAREVTDNSAEIKYFPVKIEDGQLQPSDDGETLMSVLTLIPTALSENLYQQGMDINKQKYFLLKFFPGGQKKSVLTDQRLEVRQFAHKYVNVNSRTKDNVFFWCTIIEKSFKKLYFNQFKSLSLIQMFHTIYGIDPEVIPFTNKVTITANLPKILTSLLKNQPKALIGFINDRSSTGTRIYPLLDVQYPNAVASKKSKKSQEVKDNQEILYHIRNPYSGSILSSNYVNKFTINQMFEKFNKIVVLRELPNKWAGIRVFIEFLSNGPISFTGNSWTQNSQYSFTLSKPTHARLALRRRWGSYNDPNSSDPSDSIYGFMLFKSQNGQTEISCLKLQLLVSKNKSTDQQGCIFTSTLEKGTYILIPFCNRVSQQYMQLMNLDILVERQDALCINKSKINEYYYQLQGEDSSDKVMQKLQIRTKYQKPKWEKIQGNRLWFQKQKHIDVGFIQSLGLTLMKQTTNQAYFVPGRLKRLIVNGEVKQEKRETVVKKSAQAEQIEKYERQEALYTLLGYDILMGEEINYGQMRTIVEQTSDQVDLANYYLGEEGFMAILECLMLQPRLVNLNLSNNDLNDTAITYLCYYLEKGNRKELQELNLTGNPIGKTGVKALKGLVGIYQDLKVIGVKL